MRHSMERHPIISGGLVAACTVGTLAVGLARPWESDSTSSPVAAPRATVSAPSETPTLSPKEQAAQEKQRQQETAQYKAQAKEQLVDSINEPSVKRLVGAIGQLPVGEQMDILIDKACAWRTVHYNAWAAGYGGRPYKEAISQAEGYYTYLYIKENNEWLNVNDGGMYANHALWQERKDCPEIFASQTVG